MKPLNWICTDIDDDTDDNPMQTILCLVQQAQADEFARFLLANGVPAASYHAGKPGWARLSCSSIFAIYIIYVIIVFVMLVTVGQQDLYAVLLGMEPSCSN